MRTLAASLGVLACIAVAHTQVDAQSALVVPGDAGRVSIRTQAAPLGQLLRELAAFTPMDLRLDPAVEGVSVSVDIADEPIERAIYAVLQESGVNTVVAGLYRRDDRVAIRVIAGNPREAVAVATTDLSETPSDKLAVIPLTETPPLPDEDTLRANKENERLEALAGQASQVDAVPAPGAMTAQAWIQAIFPDGGARAPRAGAVVLPFTTDDGRPLTELVPPGRRTEAMLPFVDEVGLPIVLPIQPRTDGMVMLPFVNERDEPVLVPAAPPVGAAPGTSPTPGRPPGGPGW